MAHVYKMDGTPAGPVYSYSTLAALQQAADRGDASAAILIAELPGPEQRLARGLVETYAAKATGSMPGKTAKRSRREAKAKASIAPKMPKQSMKSMLKDDLRSSDPRTRLTAEALLRKMT